MNFDFLKVLKKVILIGALLFVLLMLLTWSNIVNCNTIGNEWCGVYWGVMGSPKVLIAYGNDGLGDPQKLQEAFEDNDILGERAILRHMRNITSGTLNSYDMVIVTRSKTMTAEQLNMFISYVDKGGKLIWSADSGTISPGNENSAKSAYLKEFGNVTTDGVTNKVEQERLENLANNLGIELKADLTIAQYGGDWRRVDDNNTIIDFSRFISVKYLGNFCELRQCSSLDAFVGNLETNEDSSVARFLDYDAQFYGNFSVVDEINTMTTKKEMILKTQSNVTSADNGPDYGREFPIIVSSHTGGRVIYMAVPIENMINYEGYDNYGMNYPSVLRDLYDNLIGGR